MILNVGPEARLSWAQGHLKPLQFLKISANSELRCMCMFDMLHVDIKFLFQCKISNLNKNFNIIILIIIII